MKRNIDKFYTNNIHDILQSMNNAMVSTDISYEGCILDLLDSCGEFYGCCFLNKPQDCENCLRSYLNLEQGTNHTQLVMWHSALFSVLPERDMIKQIKDIMIIAEALLYNRRLPDLLIAPVYDYPFYHFAQYATQALYAAHQRRIDDEVVDLLSQQVYISDNIQRDLHIFYNWHTDQYLFNNLITIGNRMRRKLISEADWLKIFDTFHDFMYNHTSKKADLR